MPVASKPGHGRRPASRSQSCDRPVPWLASNLPRRWVIERSFAWLIKNRRLVRDFDQHPETSETLITIAAATTLILRLRWTFSNAH
jgi:transposase